MRIRYFLLVTVLFLGVFLSIRSDYPAYSVPKNEESKSFKIDASTSVSFEIKNVSKVVSGISLYPKYFSQRKISGKYLLKLTDDNGSLVSVVNSHSIDPEKGELKFDLQSVKKNGANKLFGEVSLEGTDDSYYFTLFAAGDASQENRVAYQLYDSLPYYQILYKEVLSNSVRGEDIFYYWERGKQILSGINPYSCVMDGDCLNHKIPQHFPLFYWLSALSEKLGLASFEKWIIFWRLVFFACYLSIGFILWYVFSKKKQYFTALFAIFFWLFNRWVLYVLSVGQISFLALIFLVVSMLLMKKRLYIAALLFGVSLAVKQVGIFLLPLYLIYAWNKNPNYKFKRTITVFLLIILVPFAATVPFLFDHPLAVINAMLFAAERDSEANMGAPAINEILQMRGVSNVSLMVFLVFLVYVAAWRKKVSITFTSAVIFIIFIAFNRVIFNQYFVWMIPFVVIGFSEMASLNSTLFPNENDKK